MAESEKAKKHQERSARQDEKRDRFQRFVSQGAREGAVIALVALCIYLGMALVTFSPSDPGWASIGHETVVQNHAGRSGAWLASLLRDFFGDVAYLFPVMVAGYALMLIRLRSQPIDPHIPLFLVRFGGFLLILLSATSLLSLYSVFGLGVSSGGVLGAAVSESMVRFFNLPATTLLLIAIFLFALTVSTGLSWFWLMDRVGLATLKVGSGIRNLFRKSEKKGVSEDANSGQKPAPGSRAEPTPKTEPPVVRDELTHHPVAKKLPWWKRLFSSAGKSGKPARKERKEPAIDGVCPDSSGDQPRLESFSSRDVGAPHKTSSTSQKRRRNNPNSLRPAASLPNP